VAMSKDAGGNYHQRLHALDLTSGVDRMAATTIQATGFVPGQYEERTGLLLLKGVIYLAWTSHCDGGAYNAWVMGYSESSLQQTSTINLTPNGNGGGIWMAGDGLAADSSGNIYFLDGNGTFDTTLTNGFPSSGDYGNGFIKLSTTNNALAVADYFEEFDTVNQSNRDQDLGSGGLLLLPDMTDANNVTRHLAVGAGKQDLTRSGDPIMLFVVDRDNMGKYNGNVSGSDTIYQELDGALSAGLYSAPVYFNGSIYFADVGGTLKQYALGAARLPSTPTSKSSASFAYPGASPSISANGSSNAIVWAVRSNSSSAAVLHAYNPANLLVEYYNSTQAAGSRDAFGNGNKFITPVVANGKVFVGTPSGVAVFGLL